MRILFGGAQSLYIHHEDVCFEISADPCKIQNYNHGNYHTHELYRQKHT